MEFIYSAVNKEGKTEKSEVQADSYHEAIGILHQKGLIPIDIKQRRENLWIYFSSRISTVSLQDKILFIQNLSVMLKAGVSITRGLKILSKQTKNDKFQKILQQVLLDVESGKSLAESLSKYPDTFSNIIVSMIRVGELSGNLDKSLEYLSLQLQREHDLISKTKGAMIYPAVVVFAVVVVAVLMSIFVLPSLVSVFKESNAELPLITKMVIAVVDFMSGHTFIALGILIGLVIGGVILHRTATGKEAFDKILLKSPVFGGIAKKINMARFSRIMSSMLKSGTPILESLQVASDSMGNSQYKNAIQQSVTDIRVGKTISRSLEKFPELFSYLVTQMVAVGEESGNVEVILGELAEHFEEEVDSTMRNLSSVIEPVLILIIGTAVGILALALISPIYSITQNVGG